MTYYKQNRHQEKILIHDILQTEQHKKKILIHDILQTEQT